VSDATTPPPEGVDLDAHSFPTVIRRSPRLVRTVVTGVLIGAVLGVVVGLGLPGSGAMDRAAVTVLVACGFAIIGGLVAGANATGSPRWTVLPFPHPTDEAR
jgi:uncharacterized protein YcfJ